MTGDEIRSKFLNYFKQKGHRVVRSSSLVPQDDPTLLFTNAGMVQFKRVFIGEEKKDFSTAATSQKCVRAGGKHNDLENVGYTARHHTFFEMLGKFSFGDYFKEKAIEYAWDLLVNGYRLPKEKLWVSVFRDDDEAYDIWRGRIGVAEERIVRLGEKDNFWAMGDTGPCGPCSEILIDRGEKYACDRPDCTAGCDCDRYLEIWNLVFMQYNRDASGNMTPLPKPSIDTGMGLERVAAVIQNAPTNYETDLILPIIRKIESLSGAAYGINAMSDIAMKVIADHSRSAAFLIGDGVLPSNEGRGYVLRRIMRRAIRYGRNLGLSDPFLSKTVEVVMEIMAFAYPELVENRAFILNIVTNEETRFIETLDNGLKLLNDSIVRLESEGKDEMPGEIIFKLYDTYGFPTDIVRDVLRDKGMRLDMEGFDRAMERQRDQSRSVAAFSEISDAYKKLTSAGFKPEFVGYDALSCNARIMMIVRKGTDVTEASTGDVIELVTDKTPFYGEAGGQVGDRGEASGPGFEITINNTIKDPTGIIVHQGEVTAGTVKKGDPVQLSVDKRNRDAVARNHTATHVLHAVLRKVLGDHVKQSGSLVSPDRLRFDFTHFSGVDRKTLNRIETLVNEHIRRNVPVVLQEMEAEEAFRSGATALFEEKYGDRVRVISLQDFSKELCGGTHTKRTGDIGMFKITGESSVAAGIRRIEALTGNAALDYTQQQSDLLQKTAEILREKPEGVLPRLERILADYKNLERQVDSLKSALAAKSAEVEEDQIRRVNGVDLLIKRVSVEKPAMLRELADRFKNSIKSGIVILGSVSDDKVMLIAGVTKDLTERFQAGKIIKQLAAEVGGGGGGRPDMAQAGGTQPENLDKALEKAEEIVKNM
ncbi:MAG: alanine--tRNA ligase [Desulfobacterales bacterium]